MRICELHLQQTMLERTISIILLSNRQGYKRSVIIICDITVPVLALGVPNVLVKYNVQDINKFISAEQLLLLWVVLMSLQSTLTLIHK